MVGTRRSVVRRMVVSLALLALVAALPAGATTYGPHDYVTYDEGGECDPTFLIFEGTCSLAASAEEQTGDAAAEVAVATGSGGEEFGGSRGEALSGFAVWADLKETVKSIPLTVKVHVDSAAASVAGQGVGVPTVSSAVASASVYLHVFGVGRCICVTTLSMPVVHTGTGPTSVADQEVIASLTLTDQDGEGFDAVYVIADVRSDASIRFQTGTAAASIAGTIKSVKVG